MRRHLIALLCLLAVCFSGGRTQTTDPKAPVSPTTPSPGGIQASAVPEILYEHLHAPGLKRGQGAVVELVVVDSPAYKAGLKRHDILISLDGTSIRDAEHLQRLLQKGSARNAPLVLLRAGREMTLQVSFANTATDDQPKGLIKPGGPPAVNVEAQPLSGGKLRVTFTFYSEGKGKLDQVVCSGSLAEIQTEVQALNRDRRIPGRVQELIAVALKRLRDLNMP
jgi:hypothetical protein